MNTSSHIRRPVAAAAGAVTAALVLTACGGTGASNSAGGNGPDGKGAASGSIVYSWWGAGERNQKTQAVIDLWQKAHPKAKIQGEPTDFTSYFQKRNVEAAAKSLPCVPQMQARELSEYTSRHALLPLDNMVKAGTIDVSGIPKDVLDTGRGSDGKLYMVPTGAAYDGIMYNEKYVHAAGVADLPNHYTWSDWSNWLMQASKKLPHGVYATNLDAGDADLFISYVQSEGKQLFSKSGQLGFDEQTLIDYWNMWEKLRKAGATVPATTAAELGQSLAEDQTPILQGKTMSATTPGNWLGSAQDVVDAHGGGTLKMTTHPYGSSGIGNVLITSGLSIAANCDNVPTAASFVNFFANDATGAKAFASDNGAVTKTSLLQTQESDPQTPSGVKRYLGVYQQIVKAGAPNILYPPGYTSVFADAFFRFYQNISLGKASVSEGVSDFFKEAKSNLHK